MILVDTSIWIDHGRRRDDQLADWLTEGLVLGHPFVQGELACGRMPRRAEVLALSIGCRRPQWSHIARCCTSWNGIV
jgi:predicted nucleic acid-binding protein